MITAGSRGGGRIKAFAPEISVECAKLPNSKWIVNSFYSLYNVNYNFCLFTIYIFFSFIHFYF